MRITKIKCHQSVTFNGRENLAFTERPIPGFPDGCKITYEKDYESFAIRHKNLIVMVPKENVPFFEVVEEVQEQTQPTRGRGRPPKADVSDLIDAAL